MLRFTEIGLFLVPLALFVTWRIMGPRTPRSAVWGALLAVAVMAVGTVWFGLHNRMPADAVYVPAQMENGRIVPGHAAPP
jgi:MFS superfamily sulfate permease-like transporter